MAYSQENLQQLASYFAPQYADLDAIYQSVLQMYPDQKGEPFSVHPNALDNWYIADSKNPNSFIKWIERAYSKLITDNPLPQNVVRPGNQKPVTLDSSRPGTVQNKGQVSVYHAREWAKKPSEYASELSKYPHTFAYAYAIDLATLDNQLAKAIGDAQDYRRKHPPDTSLGEALAPVVDALATIAPIVQLVVSFVPGVGTIASMAIGATAAALEGKSLDEILQASVVGAVPGGPLAVAAASAAVNIAKTAVKGENILKSTGTSLYTASLQFIEDPKLRETADRAIRAIAAGKNVLTTTEKAALDVAISQIPDSNAQALVREAISGHLNPKTTLIALVSSQLPASSFSDSLIAAAKNVVSDIRIANSEQLLKNARDEIVAAASNFITDQNARKILGDATSTLISSCNSTAVSRQLSASEKQALVTIKDPAAQKIFQTILSGHCSPQDVFAATDGKLIQVMVKSDVSSNVAKLLIADSAPKPKLSSSGAVLSGGIQSGTLRWPTRSARDGRTANGEWQSTKGSFMQLPGIGTPTLQFQPDGSTQWTVGFWLQVSCWFLVFSFWSASTYASVASLGTTYKNPPTNNQQPITKNWVP